MNNLKKIRIKRNMTQKMLANNLKMSQQALSLIERNERSLTEDNIIKLCKILDTTPNDLIKWN